jgi:hypothetical protein
LRKGRYALETFGAGDTLYCETLTGLTIPLDTLFG